MTDFSTISTSYREKSLVQASAGQELIGLLPLTGQEDILDIGCGPGHLTATLRGLTAGRVVGIDQAAGMIRQAREQNAKRDIEFQVMDSERMPFADEFDAIFCNSVCQWFTKPAATLQKFHRVLRPAGRVAMQAPATHNYGPNFIKAIDHCRRSAEIDALFAGFRSPWFFLDSAPEYQALFEEAGFTVHNCRLAEVHQSYSPAQAFDVFNSGAAAGYLNPAYFSAPLPADFADQVLQGVRESLAEQAAANGEIDLVFYRIFVLAQKIGPGA